MTVYAAGAVLWREKDGHLMVGLIHRGRYDDYGWAKGKLDPGEVLPQTAVREVLEETGLKIRLGISLGAQHYTLPNGQPKEVHIWAARVTDSALAKSKFVPHEEVDEVLWMSPIEAAKVLSYDADKVFLATLVEYHKRGLLRTKPFILLRHAKATPRTDWSGPDGKRPLLPIGFSQAKSIAPILGAFGIKRIFSSPWLRCYETVAPFAISRKIPVIERHQLSELGSSNGPTRTKKVVHDIIDDGRPSVLCSHRPSLPSILDAVSSYGDAGQEIRLHEGRALKPGHLMVVHLTPATPGHKRKIVAIEDYAPFIAE
jgi:8-oxo-(d)GTP phosphatase